MSYISFDHLSSMDITLINIIRELNWEIKKISCPDHVRADKKNISSLSDLSIPAVSGYISKLSGDTTDTAYKENPLVILNDRVPMTCNLKSEAAYFIGISVGSLHVKLVLLDFSFNIVEYPYKYRCIETGVSLEDIKNIVAEWINPILGDDTLNIKGICVAFPGFVDTQNEIVENSANLSYINHLRPKHFFKNEVLTKIKQRKIRVHFQHNAKACILSEKIHNKNVSIYNDKNVISIYMGKGINMGAIINNALYTSMFSGELGHMKIFHTFNESKDTNGDYRAIKEHGQCGCGQYGCVEQIIRNDVFKCKTSADFAILIKERDNLDRLEDDEPKKLAYYLFMLINNIASMFCPQKIILSGILARHYDEIFEYAEDILAQNCLPNIKSMFEITKSDISSTPSKDKGDEVADEDISIYTAAIGAAIYSYYRFCNDIGNQEANCTGDISWSHV